jgi:DNA-binding FadR family transcriptional regulator
MAIEQAVRRTLVDAALAALKAELATGNWPLGTRIPIEPELALTLGVSRNTVREAVRALVHAGMLETRQGDGTYVRSLTDGGDMVRQLARASLRDRLEVRAGLEVEAARLAALRRTEPDLARMAAALDARGEWPGPADLDRFVDHDLAFHQAIAEATHNPALIALYGFFSAEVRQSIRQAAEDAQVPDPSLADHAAILHAIRERAPERAAAAVRQVLQPMIAILGGLIAEQPAVGSAP